MSFTEHMSAGNSALDELDYEKAFNHFSEAHALGRQIRAKHLAAHRAMMRAGWSGRRPGRYLTHFGLWAGAHLTSNHANTEIVADK